MGAVFEAKAGTPVLVGHRGCGAGDGGDHAENTLESFLAAAAAGADWLEVDVARTADDDLVVHHNLAYADGTPLAAVTGAQAVERGTVRLVELLDALPAGVGVDFDLKSSMVDARTGRSGTTAGIFAPVAARTAAVRPVLVTSFDPAACDIVREAAPGVPLGLLTYLDFPIGHAVAAAVHLDVQVLAVHHRSLWPKQGRGTPAEIVETLHGAGRELMAWNVSEEEIDDLAAAGMDAACVDDVGRFAARRVPVR